MKKFVLIAFCCAALGAPGAYALTENYLSLGASFANSLQSSNTEVMGQNVGTVSISLSDFLFWNKNSAGLYLGISFFDLPVYRTGLASSVEATGGEIGTGMALGPGFRLYFSDNLGLLIGIGPYLSADRFSQEYADGSRLKMARLNLGLLAEAGIKFDISSVVYAAGGIRISGTFVSHITVEDSAGASGWRAWPALGTSVFLGVGINAFDETETLGKLGKK